MPELIGLNVLDLGCGFGDFARYARAHDAHTVTAVDGSTKMIIEARRLTDDTAIEFICSSIEDLSVQSEKFGLIVSSMALHYVEDFKNAVQRILDILKPGGYFVFSVEHPVCTANPEGWVRDQEGTPSIGHLIAIKTRVNAVPRGLSTTLSSTIEKPRATLAVCSTWDFTFAILWNRAPKKRF